MNNNFIQEYKSVLQEKIDSLTEFVVNNRLGQEEYTTSIGSIKALKEAKEHFNDLIKKYYMKE